jgi:hypothetical protein
MKTRMMCTDCLRTAEADTVVEGSDAMEMLGWCCFVLPGLLYCWWRHALRIKVCSFCGGRELVREARAAAAREPAQASAAGGARVRSEFDPIAWPALLAGPRDRLRIGGTLFATLATIGVSLLLAALNVAVNDLALIGANLVAAACAWPVVRDEVRDANTRIALSHCRAWDDEGRELRIERVV